MKEIKINIGLKQLILVFVIFWVFYSLVVEYTLSHLKLQQINENDNIVVMTFYNQTWVYERGN